MKTSKLFSTISYNTKDFLKSTLDGFVQKNIIYWYAFINHIKEEDERKDHIHLLIMPNGTIETDKLLKQLEEYDPNNPLHPLRCRPPHKTNVFGDWYLYNKHDEKYLLAHGHQTRKYHYSREDFITNDDDEFDDLIHTIDYRKMYGNQAFFEGLNGGKSVVDMVQEGTIPIQQYGQFAKFAFDYTEQSLQRTFRNGNTTHTPLIDENTGEIL